MHPAMPILASCDRALVIDDCLARAHAERANVLCDLGRPDVALASYARALARDPSHADIWTNVGNALKQLGRLPQALQAHDRAVGLRPDWAALVISESEHSEREQRHRYDRTGDQQSPGERLATRGFQSHPEAEARGDGEANRHDQKKGLEHALCRRGLVVVVVVVSVGFRRTGLAGVRFWSSRCVVVSQCEYLVLVHGREFFDERQGLVVAVRLVQAEHL